MNATNLRGHRRTGSRFRQALSHSTRRGIKTSTLLSRRVHRLVNPHIRFNMTRTLLNRRRHTNIQNFPSLLLSRLISQTLRQMINHHNIPILSSILTFILVRRHRLHRQTVSIYRRLTRRIRPIPTRTQSTHQHRRVHNRNRHNIRTLQIITNVRTRIRLHITIFPARIFRFRTKRYHHRYQFNFATIIRRNLRR